MALAQLEEMEGNVEGCRELYERVLLIRPEAEIYWTQYEVMERRFGHVEHAMRIEQRRHLAFGGKSGEARMEEEVAREMPSRECGEWRDMIREVG